MADTVEGFRQAIADAGLEPPAEIIPDGKIHRFASSGKRGDMAGWYTLHADDPVSGAFGCWREGITRNWCAKGRDALTPEERRAFRERVQAARKEADRLRQQAQERAAEEARRRWEAAEPADPGHPYLRAKGVQPHSLRQEGSYLLVPVRGITGEWQSLQTIGPDGSKRFLPGGKVAGGMCWIGERQEGAPVLLCEGWATGASLHDATGHLVVVAFNAGNLLPVAKAVREKLPDARLIIAADNDHATEVNPGLKKAKEAAGAVGAALCWPEGISGTDFNDLHQERGLSAVREAVEAAAPVEEIAPPVVIRCLADVKPAPLRWLWPGRVARGKVTVIAGHPGLGKSQLTASLAAITTTGGVWPVDRARAEVGSVVFLTAEDDAADTLRPRLDAAGADVRRCHVLDAVLDDEGRPRSFDLGRDLERLEWLLKRLGDVVLVVIDPVTAYLGGVDSHKNADVRALLAPLSELAARHRVAVVAVSHLNKAGGTDALLRVSGSLAFTAAARAAWLVAKDPQDEGRRLFLPMKNNLGPDATGLAFRVEGVTLEGGIATSRIVWESEPVTIDANTALMPVGDEVKSKREEAAEWLLDELRNGPVEAEDLKARAKAAGHAWPTVKRAKSALGIKGRKSDFSEGWRWYPPGSVEGDQCEEDHPLPQESDPLRWKPHKYYVSGTSDPLGNAEGDHLLGSDPLRGNDPLGETGKGNDSLPDEPRVVTKIRNPDGGEVLIVEDTF